MEVKLSLNVKGDMLILRERAIGNCMWHIKVQLLYIWKEHNHSLQLLSIIVKDQINEPPRLQRMLLWLHKYNVTTVYCNGLEIVFADHLSRNLDTKSETGRIIELAKLSIAYVDLNVSQVKLSEIQEKTKLDPEPIQV